MNNKARRFLSFFLSVVMVLSLLNGFVLPAKEAEAAPATLNGYTDFSDKLVSHEITVDGQKLNSGDTINPNDSFALKLSFKINNMIEMSEGGLKYFFKLPDHISIGNQGSVSNQKTLYNSKRDAIGSYYILDDVIYVEFPGYYDGVNAFFEMEALWDDTNNRSKIKVPWPDGEDEYLIDFSDLAVVKNQSGYINQQDGSLKNNFSIIIRGKRDDVAIDNVKFEDIFSHTNNVNIVKDAYGSGKDIKVSYYDSTNSLVNSETYKLSTVGNNNGFSIDGLSLAAGGYIKIEYSSVIEYDKRLAIDGSKNTDSYNNTASASYNFDNPTTGETETLTSSSSIRGSYEGGTDWIMKDASDETKVKNVSGTQKTVVPYTVNVNRHRFYSLGGSAVHDEITNYTGGDVVYDTSSTSETYVLRVVDSNNKPDGDRIDQKWVILDDDVYNRLQTLCQAKSSKTEYEQINDSANNTLKQALLSAIRSQYGGSESAFDEDTALNYIFTDSSNHNFVWITPPDSEPTTYIIHYDTIVDNEVGTFKNGASLWYTEYDVTYAAPGNGWHRPVKKVLNSSKTNFGVYVGEDGNFYVDYKVTVGLAPGSAGFDGIAIVDEFANHTVDINGKDVTLYDFLTGFNSDDVDLSHLTGEENRKLVTPCFEITTDSDNPKVQDVCKNAYALFYHNVNGDSGADEFYKGYDANVELVLRDYNSKIYHGDAVEAGQFILYNDVYNYDGRRIIANKGETVSPKSAVVWLGDLPAAEESKGYNIILKYTMQVNPVLIEKLPELLENSTDKYVANKNIANVYEKYWYNDRYIVNFRENGKINEAESSYWIGIDDDHPGLTKKLNKLASDNSKASYELEVNPDESIVATEATGAMTVKYEIEDVMNIPGLKYIKNSFTLKDKSDKVVWTNNPEKSADASYASYADSISFELTNEDSESNRYKILLDNTDGKFTDSNNKLMKLYVSYDVDISSISTDETITNTSTLSELVKDGQSGPEKKKVLGEDTVEFAIDKALEKKLSNKANANNNFVSSYYVDVNPNSDNAKELKDIKVGDKITIEDELSDTLEVVPGSVKVYQYKGRDFENEEDISSKSNIAYHTDNNTLVVAVTVEDKEYRYRVCYDAKVIGGSNEYVKCVNTAKVRGTTVTLDQTIDKVLIHDYRDGSEAVKNRIKIEKFDEYNTRKHLNAKFDIYKGTYENNQMSWKNLTDGSSGYGPVETGDDGIVTIENDIVNTSAPVLLVEPNCWYKLVEIDAPDGYMLRDEPIYYYVSESGEDLNERDVPKDIDKYVLARLVPEDIDGSKAPIIRVSNQKFGFDINKVLKGTDKNLKGAEFAVYSNSNCSNSSLIEKVKDGGSEYDTEEDGIIKFRNLDVDLDSDTIYLKETKAPDGCILDGNVYEIKIADGYVSEVSDGKGHSYACTGQTVTTDGCGNLVSVEGNKEIPLFEIANEESMGRLVVKKKVELASDETLEKSFNFAITIKDKNDKVVSGTYDAIRTDVDGNETSETYINQSIFTLKSGEQFELIGIPKNYTYEVKEVVDNKFVTTIEQSDSAGRDDKSIDGNNAEGTIDESGVDTIEFTNTGTIELKLSKSCVDTNGKKLNIPDGLTFELKAMGESFFKIKWDAVASKFVLEDGANSQITFTTTENGVDIIGIPLYRNRQYYLSESGADINGLVGKLSYTINGNSTNPDNNNTITFYPNSIKSSVYGDYPVDNYVEINAVNTYDENYVETEFSATKEYNKNINVGDFAFDLYQIKKGYSYTSASSVLLQTVYAKADGTISFDSVKFISEGEYYFVIKERVPEGLDRYNTKDGITYDNDPKKINVVVTKNTQTGKLEVTSVENGTEHKFTNKYAASGSIKLEGTKNFNKSQDADAFTFKLTEYTDDTYSTVKNDDDGNPIVKETGNSSQSRANADSKFSFDLDYSYDKGDVGKHYYKIIEVDPNQDDGITYDDREIKVVVTVNDDNKGSLEVTKEVDAANGIHFDNTYNANGKIAFAGNKTFVNHNIADGQFTFKITEYTNNSYDTVKKDSSNDDIIYNASVDAASVDNDGKAVAEIKYPEIKYTYDDLGSHYYLVEEVIPEDAVDGVHNGITYDNNRKKIRVDVYDSGNGKLNVVANYVSNDASFTNRYKATGKISLSGKKILRGRNIKANEFLIYGTCKDVNANTTSNPAIYGRVGTDGVITFDDIEYDQNDDGKEYVYTFYENEPNTNPGGLTYSDEVYTMTVSIVDNGAGKLDITKTIVNKEGKSVDSLDFVNIYDASASIKFKANKVLKGRDIEAGQFEFDILEGDKVVSSGSNDAKGDIAFAEINYYIDGSENGVDENIGTHNYVVKERVPDPVLAGYTYSNKTYNVKVVVSDNGDGTLKVVVTGADVKEGSVTYDITKADTDEATFINKYEAKGELQFEGTKTLTGRSLDDKEFKFEVFEYKVGNNAAGEETLTATGKTYIASNTKSGKIKYDLINYIKNESGNDVGMYKYVIKEVIPTDTNGVTYDDTSYEVYVNVEDADDGTLTVTPSATYKSLDFTNKYEATGSLSIKARKLAMKFDDKKIYDDVNSDGKNMGNVFTFEVYEMHDKDSYDGTGVADKDKRFVNKLVSEGSCKVGEEVKLSDIIYSVDDVGNHVYKFVEKKGDAKGYTYDESEYFIVVNVEDGRKGILIITVEEANRDEAVRKLLENGADYNTHDFEEEGVNDPTDPSVISSGATVYDDGKAFYESEFINTYIAEANFALDGDKTVENLELNILNKNIMTDGAFKFSVTEYNKSGKKIYSDETVNGKSLKDGSIIFDAIHYTLEDVGTHYYMITEDVDKQIANVIYSAKPVCVKVVVKNVGDGTLSAEATYARCDNIKDFIKNSDNRKLEKASFVNKLTEVKIKKFTESGKVLAGAKMAILNKKGKTVYKFTSEKEETVVYGLSKDVTYTLHEVKAPSGYELADDIDFRIDENGKVYLVGGKKDKKTDVIKMTDKKKHKKISDDADSDNDKDEDNNEDTRDAHRDRNNEERTVETGDHSRMAMMLIIFMLSGMANVYLLTYKRRNRKNNKSSKN